MDDFQQQKDALVGTASARMIEERLRLDLSQTQIIKETGLSPMSLSRYESSGKEVRQPRFDALTSLGLMGYDVGYVVTGVRSSASTALSDDEQQLLTHYRQAQDKAGLKKMVQAYVAAEER